MEQVFQAPAWQDLVILEGHVRDFVHAPIELSEEERKGYAGLRKQVRRVPIFAIRSRSRTANYTGVR